ncbi:hypothetical protein [Marinilabilia rubra]|uniref:VRR-NUC domain-containing protein n=1 Tax=Marinilabilia rubra TaxID=2162893 RepID=A0A2U2BD43_9BACT|nr:hypothetical protein [Marinilabilia rubra]PWE00996.1 hypothetical protein DDZ16_00470 [Marinilabilia rubra]
MDTKEKVSEKGQTQKHYKNKEKQALKKLRQLHREKNPGKRIPTYETNTANGLTKCIIDYLNMKGQQAERVQCIGAPIPQGNGLYKFGKTTMHRGTADISATIKGRSVKIEIKANGDKMSSYQWQYKKDIEQAGGLYFIAHDFVGFLYWIHQNFKEGKK